MTRQEVMQRVISATLQALENNEAFIDACNDLTSVGLRPHVDILIRTYRVVDEESVKVVEQTDAEFLRSLRIAPDLEAQ
jgi:hypothetical protein